MPKLYIKTVADLETVMNETIAKQKVTPKKMNAINTRGLNAVRQTIRKENKNYEKEIEAYRKDEDDFMREQEPDEKKPAAKKSKKKVEDFGETAVGEADDEGFTMVGAGGRAVLYTPEGILKHLRSIVDQRGRKNADRLEHIRTLEKLSDVAVNDYQRIRVLLTVISTRFDLTSGTGSQMSQEQWRL